MTTTFSTRLSHFDDTRVYNRHFVVPSEIANTLLKAGNRFIVTLNNKLTFPCAILKKEEQFYVLMNKQNCNKLGLDVNQSFEVAIELDNSEFGMPMPPELDFLLHENGTFKNYFLKLTPGKQRNLIYIVDKLKNPEARTNKALAICDHLLEFNGAIDFKALNEKIKEYNQKRIRL